MVTIKTSTGGLEQIASRLSKGYTDEFHTHIQELIKDDIKDRMKKGVDVNNDTMNDYKPNYKKKKENAGKYTGVVNLKWTGTLLNSLQGKTNGIITSVEPASDQLLKAEGNQARRNWFGLSSSGREKILSYAREFLGTILKH